MEFLALDLGASRLNWVHLVQRRTGPEIKGFWIDEIPSGSDDRWKWNRLKERVIEQNWRGKGVLLINSTLPFFLRYLRIPPVPSSELKKAIYWQIRDQLSFPIESAVIDYCVMQDSKPVEGAQYLEILVAAVLEKQVYQLIDSVEQAGLEVLGFSLVPVSLWQGILFTSNNAHQTLLLLEIGYSTTFLSILSNGNLQFNRQMPTAGETMTEAISGSVISEQGRVDLTMIQAEGLKRRHGIPDRHTVLVDSETGAALVQVGVMMRLTLERIVNEIQRTLDYYRLHFSGGKIDQILLSGGGGLLKGMDSFLSQALNIPVSYLNLPEKLGAKVSLEAALRLNAACGLAMGRFLKINLLPLAYRNRRLKKVRSTVLRVAGVSLGAMMLLFYFFNLWQVQQTRIALSAAHTEWNNIHLIHESKKELDEHLKVAEALSKGSALSARLIRELSQVVPANLLLEVFDFDLDKKQLNLEGFIFAKEGETEQELSSFIQRLKQSLDIANVRLIITEQQIIAEQNASRFKILCDLSQ